MTNAQPLERLLAGRLVAIVRAPRAEPLLEVAQALLAGGIDAIEITFTVPRAERVLERLADTLGDRILLGAGTVLDVPTARMALSAGAQYLVTPIVQLDVIRTGRRYGKPVLAGAMTPTEILAAWEAGSEIVKVFPCDVLGPAYLKAVAGPLPQVRLMPTGGVNLQTAGTFLAAGACALGVGGSLVEPQAVADGNWQRIESLARQYVEIVRQFSASQRGAKADG